jgi:hypothetical protein
MARRCAILTLMADRTLTLHLDAYMIRKLRGAAEAAGLSPERMAEMILTSAVLGEQAASGTEAASAAGVEEPAAAWTDARAPGLAGRDEAETEPGDYAGPYVDLDLALDADAASRLGEKAKAAGMSPGPLATSLLNAQLFDYADFTWINGDPREDDVSSDASQEPGRPWSEVRPEFMALIDKTFGEPG